MKGTIIKGIGGFYYVRTDDGIIECKARGVFRKNGITPMIGDNAEIKIINDDKGNIEKIYERKNFLVRPAVANIDILAAAAACKDPEPDMAILDKMLINAEAAGIEPVICINKTDLSSPEVIIDIYKNTGYKIFCVSAKKQEGFDELLKYIRNKTTAFSGLSGVGKSSIMNIITEKFMQTGDVSRINRGRHTTRHIELIPLEEGGYVLDTPGFSSIEINMEAENLYDHFPEMRGKICRFRGCSHITEPECGVREAVKAGIISQSRYENYKQFYSYLKSTKKY